MAYYQTGYRYRRYKKHSGRKKWIILAAVLAAVIGVFVFFHKNVSGMLYSLSEATVRAAATEAVNDAVSQTLGGTTSTTTSSSPLRGARMTAF